MTDEHTQAEQQPAQPDSPIERTLQQMLADRMQVARDLAGAASQLEEQRAQLAEAERSYRAAYDLALNNGWRPIDLRKIGLPTPAPKPRSRTRRKKNDTTNPPTDNS